MVLAPVAVLTAMVVALSAPAASLDAQAATILHRPAATVASPISPDPTVKGAVIGEVASSTLPAGQDTAEALGPDTDPMSTSAQMMPEGLTDESIALGAAADTAPDGVGDINATLGAADKPVDAAPSAADGLADGTLGVADGLGQGSAVVDAAGSAAPISDAPLLIEQVQTYYVAPGDSLTTIARRFGIDVDTLRAANAVSDANLLFVGQALSVLPVPGVLEKVTPGDTVAALALRYGVPAEAIDAANGLDDATPLTPGQQVLVPGGKPLALPLARSVVWPTAGTGKQQKAQFIAAAVPAAQASQRETGVPAAVTIAQAILESDWGDSELAWAANNFFGIKATATAASGSVYWLPSWEVVDGQDMVSVEPFRAYGSPEASFVDHGLFFRQNSRYWPALALASDPAAFAQAIASAGYATDPAYGAKLIALMNTYQLYQYDVA